MVDEDRTAGLKPWSRWHRLLSLSQHEEVLALRCGLGFVGVHRVRTSIEIDDQLMQDALRATGAKSKKEVVELGLRTLLELHAQEQARTLQGKITWEGDLDATRTNG